MQVHLNHTLQRLRAPRQLQHRQRPRHTRYAHNLKVQQLYGPLYHLEPVMFATSWNYFGSVP